MSINAMDVLSFIFGGNDGDGSFNLNVSVSILTVENCRKSIISIYIKDYSNMFVWMKTVGTHYKFMLISLSLFLSLSLYICIRFDKHFV